MNSPRSKMQMRSTSRRNLIRWATSSEKRKSSSWRSSWKMLVLRLKPSSQISNTNQPSKELSKSTSKTKKMSLLIQSKLLWLATLALSPTRKELQQSRKWRRRKSRQFNRARFSCRRELLSLIESREKMRRKWRVWNISSNRVSKRRISIGGNSIMLSRRSRFRRFRKSRCRKWILQRTRTLWHKAYQLKLSKISFRLCKR